MVRLTNAAEALHRIAPGSVPAIYYLAMARLRQVQPLLADMSAADRPDWDRFTAGYQRLSFDLGLAVRVAECR